MKYKKHKLSQAGVLCGLLIILILGAAGCASRNITMQQATGQEGIDDSVAKLKLITGISTSESEGTVGVHVNSDGGLTYSSIKQPLPLSVILYFPETALKDSIAAEIKENSIIGSVKASELPGTGHTSRIMIPLNKDVDYEVVSEETGLRIVFSRPAEDRPRVVGTLESGDKAVPAINGVALRAAAGIVAAPAASAGKKAADKGNPPVDIKKAVAGTVNPDIAPNIAWVNRIDFSSEDAGKSTIIVGTTRPVEYKIEKAGSKRLNLRLDKAKIPPYHNRPLITTRFASAVDRITPVQASALKDTSILSIELRESVPYFVEQSENLLFIHFAPSSIPPRPLEKADLPPWKTVLEQTAAAVEYADRQAKAKPSPQVSSAQKKNKEGFNVKVSENKGGSEDQPKYKEDGSLIIGKGAWAEDYDLERQDIKDSKTGKRKDIDIYRSEVVKKYTGEKIALDFYETDVKNVFRILKEVSGKNFAIDKDVSGTVSLTFDRPVPWDQVLDLVMKMNQLDKVYEGDVIRIATLKTLRQEEAALKSKLKAKQESELQEDLVTVFLPVNYADAGEIAKLIQIEGRGSISVDERNNTIVITAAPIAIKRAKEIVQKVDQVTPQVIIEARVVEVTESFSRAIGVNWSADGEANLARASDSLDYSLAFDHAVAGTSSIGAVFERVAGSEMLLNAQLTAAQSEGNAKIISSPKVITLDNETATIKQGEEFPYLERDDSGGSSVKYKNIDLLLEVTPHITPDGRISMELKITKNDLADMLDGVPRVTTKEINTCLLVEDGDTIVIGGVMQSAVRSGEAGTPWLSKIPVLGWLFKSKTKSNNKSELLIFITPNVVQI
jgi:type IV pilus assembly protein PilQ